MLTVRPEESRKIVGAIDVAPSRKKHGTVPTETTEVLCKGGKNVRGRPGKVRKRRRSELLTRDPDQINPIFLNRGSQHGHPVSKLLRDTVPIHVWKLRTVTPDGDNSLVAPRKGESKRMREAGPEVIPSLLRPVDLDHGIAALLNGATGMIVEGRCDLPIFLVVLGHEPLVLPLALGALGEEQYGGMVGGLVNTDPESEDE